jgi:hypothetical protein
MFKPFQPRLIFVKKAGANPNDTPLRCSTLGQALDLAHKHYTMLERLARDKHSKLIQALVNYGRNLL